MGDGLQSTAVRPSRFRFYVDDNCRDVAEVLLHAWLKLQGLPAGVCHLAEALLAKRCPDKGLQLPHRIKQEVASMAPVQLAEVSHLVTTLASGPAQQMHTDLHAFLAFFVAWQIYASCKVRNYNMANAYRR